MILSSGKISKQDIAYSLHLSLPTVTQYLSQLMDDNLILEDGTFSSSVGRRAKALTINPNAKLALGLDITQHHIALVAVDLCGAMVHSVKQKYVFSNSPVCYKYLGSFIDHFIEEYQLERDSILGLGVSVPGIVTRDGTYVEVITLLDNANNLYRDLKPYVIFPMRLYNDANAGGFSELYLRHDVEQLIYLSLSHSIGGAIINHNRINNGINCRSGEFGHMIMVPNGNLCHCGQHGCVNCYCTPDLLSAHTGGDLDLFFKRLEEEDALCVAAFKEYLEYLSILLHNIRMCFDCDIVIGGGMGPYIAEYIDPLRELVRAKDSFDNSNANYVKPGSYSYETSAVGDALFFIDNFIRAI